MSKPRQFTAVLILLSVVLILTVHTQAQTVISGPNVNMVSGTTWPDGDPYLQRQNEPSIAVSTRNSLHLLAASNDYRTVDLPGLPDGLPIADSWIGVYTSLDGGGSWTSTLLPGYPQDLTVAGQASPAYGLQAAADPVMRAGTHGMFYLSGIVFDRGATPESKLFVARYVDLNNDPNNPIQYIDTVEVASYTFPSNVFIDKPWLAVDVPEGGAATTTFYVEQSGNPSSPVAQAVECGNLYLAWAEIESVGDTVVESRLLTSTSTDCGSTWSSPIQLSDPGTINQGAVVAVSPNPGNVYVAWRQLAGLSLSGECLREPGFWLHELDWPSGAIPMVIGSVTYTEQTDLVAILASPGSAHGDARYILARQLIAAKLNQFDLLDPSGAGVVIAQADAWFVAHPFGGPKPKKADKSAGTALATELEYYNSGLLGPMACGTVPTSDDAIMVTASTNGGSSFDGPSLVRELDPFEAYDQGTTEWSFRTTAYPTMTVDAAGRIYIAWSERGDALPTGDSDPVLGDSRIVVGTSLYPFASSPWTDVTPIDRPEIPGHQIQPTLTTVNGQLFLLYNDFRKDYSGVFDRFVMDLLTVAQPYRHTVDLRAAVADPGASPVFTDYTVLSPPWPDRPSTQASRYLFMPTIQGTPPSLIFEQLDFNPPNLPMFKAGTVPFYGDYVDIAGLPFVPDGMGGWTYNTGAWMEPIAHAVWTDNRDVIGPPDGDWTSFIPPGSGGTSIFDGTTVVPPCAGGTDDADRTGMRNQNIYTSRLTTGLYVAVPGNSRPLMSSFQRGFVIFVQNGTDSAKAFSLEILPPQPTGGAASFDQFSSLIFDEVDLLAYSSASRTVFATSTDPTASIAVQVTEIDPVSRLPVAGGLAQTVLINPDPSNPGPSDPTLLAGEVHNPAVLNPAVYNPAVYNPAVLNPAVFNPAVFNPAVFNPAVFNDAVLNYSVDNPAVFNPAVLNPAVYNPAVFNPAVFNEAVLAMSLMNPAVYNPAVLNPAVFNPAVLNPAVFNPAVFNPAVLNPAVLNPAVFNPAVFNPAVLNPAVMNPAVLNPAVYNTTFADGSATDFNLIAANTGNATSAYSLNLNLLNQVPGFHYQLMVYRIYFTPVANDCALTEAAQQELLVNDLDPDLSAYLLNAYSDASFYLNPGDYAVMTLRITPDPDAPVPGDLSTFDLESLSASVVAQAVNSADAAAGETQPPASAWLAPTLPPLVITTTTLANATQGVAYSATLTAAGGSGPLTWNLAPGSALLPTGLTLSSAGVIAGTPTVSGTFNITVRTTDYSQIAEQPLTLAVDAPLNSIAFVKEPGSTNAGQPIPNFTVRVTDDLGSLFPGVAVQLTIGNYGCATASMAPLVPAAVTNASGIATFSGVSIDRGGSGYTLVATATPSGFPTINTESKPFNVVGTCTTSPLGMPRVGATVTRLPDGRVLVAGGVDDTNTPLASAEIYDPVTATWTSRPMYFARTGHTATLLASGRVLITGGSSDPLPATTALASTEFFDPDYAGGTGGFGHSPTTTLTVPRMGHTARRLPNGKVLFVGGRSIGSGPSLNSAETCEFNMSGFTATTGAPTARDSHTATILDDGRVLLVGGASAPFTYLNTAEIYDAATDSFSSTGSMSSSRLNHAATRLGDGRVLITGGTDGTTTFSTAEIFDPAAGAGVGAFAATGGMSSVRQQHAATALSNGQILVTGGITAASGPALLLGSAELFDPFATGGAGGFSDTDSMTTPRRLHGSTRLVDGMILITGGFGPSGSSADTELYTPTTSKALWTNQFGTSAFEQVYALTTDATAIYVAGGSNGTFPTQSNSGGFDSFVRKLGLSKNEIWTRQFGSASDDYAQSVAVDPSGVYVAGYLQSGALPGQTPLGLYDAYLRKYDFGGTELWTRQFGTAVQDHAYAVSTDASGVYVGGKTVGTFPGQTGGGAYVRKYDHAGNELWTRQFGVVQGAEVTSLSAGDSGVYAAGSGAIPGQPWLGGFDSFVRRFDGTGNEIWTRQFGSAASDYATSLSIGVSGVYVAGYTQASLPSQTSQGGDDAYVRKYDHAGSEVWTRQFGTSELDQAFGVSVDASGVHIAGNTRGSFPDQTLSGSTDAFVRTYSPEGVEISTWQFGISPTMVQGRAVAADASGVYVAGVNASHFPGETYYGAWDGYVRRFTTPAAIHAAAGSHYGCAVKPDRSIACWGIDDRGQASPPLGAFKEVAVGSLFTCGLQTDKTAVCWGWDNDPQMTPPPDTFSQVTVGSAHACGLKPDGTVLCWGNNYYGGATPPGGTFVQIDAGSAHTCGVESSGSVSCWGYDYSGQATPPAGTFTHVAAGDHHSCAIETDGSVTCWGLDTHGESTPPAGTFTHISAGIGYHSCGLKTDGSVTCWGSDVYGESTPYVGSFTQVSAGYIQSCGVRTDGSVVCWGGDQYGGATPPPSLQ